MTDQEPLHTPAGAGPADGTTRLLRHFLAGTDGSVSFGSIGCEIETPFITEDTGEPIPAGLTERLLASNPPAGVAVRLELGRQNIELAIDPAADFSTLWARATAGLEWLYTEARRHGAVPFHHPVIETEESLLLITDDRDRLWRKIDGAAALEQLARISSVQFTIEVSHQDAIPWINRLHNAQLHGPQAGWSYAKNDATWRRYLELSQFPYRPDRYGGPSHFRDIDDYVAKLTEHVVVMHSGQLVAKPLTELPDANLDLLLRSVWWHYRLRRYGSALCLEVRPFPRLADALIPTYYSALVAILDAD